MFQRRTLWHIPCCFSPPAILTEPSPPSSTWIFEIKKGEECKGNDCAYMKGWERNINEQQAEKEFEVNNIIMTPSAMALWTGPKCLCRWLLWLLLQCLDKVIIAHSYQLSWAVSHLVSGLDEGRRIKRCWHSLSVWCTMTFNAQAKEIIIFHFTVPVCIVADSSGRTRALTSTPSCLFGVTWKTSFNLLNYYKRSSFHFFCAVPKHRPAEA